MKRFTFVLTIFLLLIGCNKDKDVIPSPPTVEDPKENEDPMEDIANYVVLDGFIGQWHQSTKLSSDGNVLVTGYKRTGQKYNMIVTKTNTLGEIIFSTLVHQQNSKGMGVYEDGQQNIYVVGSAFEESWYVDRRLAVAKLDKNGNVIWEQIYHPEEYILGISISALNDNEIIVSGSTENQSNLVLLKIDSLGQEISFKTIDSPDDYKTPSSMLVLQDGNILITDYGNNKFNLTWFDQEFNVLWEKSYGEDHRVCRSSIQLNDGSIVTVGEQTHVKEGSNVIDSSKVLIIKTDPKGELLWEKEVGDTKYLNDGQSIAVNQDGSFVINGYALSDHLNNTDHMIIYVDADGNEINSRYFTDEKTFRGANIIKVENDRNVMTGGYQGGTYFLNVDNYGN